MDGTEGCAISNDYGKKMLSFILIFKLKNMLTTFLPRNEKHKFSSMTSTRLFFKIKHASHKNFLEMSYQAQVQRTQSSIWAITELRMILQIIAVFLSFFAKNFYFLVNTVENFRITDNNELGNSFVKHIS